MRPVLLPMNPRLAPLFASLLLAGLAFGGGACAIPGAEAPATPSRPLARQAQALTAESEAEEPSAAARLYEVRFASPAGATLPASMAGAHRLSILSSDGELTVDLAGGELTLTGVADVLDAERWMVGLAGLTPDGAPMVMHMSVSHAGPDLTGSVVVDANGASFQTSFRAVRATAPLEGSDGTAADDGSRDTQYHLPDGVH